MSNPSSEEPNDRPQSAVSRLAAEEAKRLDWVQGAKYPLRMHTGAKSGTPLKVGSLTGFLTEVQMIRRLSGWFTEEDPLEPWFRGEPDADMELKPKLYRGTVVPSTNNLREREDEIREEFIKRAPILCEAIPVGDEMRSEWEWYFMMQHHHVATRLLDWTDGALIALHFAVTRNTGDNHAAVWVLDPYQLNTRAIRKEWVIPPSAPGIDPKMQKVLARWLPKRFGARRHRLPQQAVAIEPTHVVRRMSSQHSCFTIHGSDPMALERLAGESNPCLFKIVILKSGIKKIERELRLCGIDESTIFPDMDGLGRSVNARWGIHDAGWLGKARKTI